MREQVEDALQASRLVEADTLVDELLKLSPDDLSAQTLERRVNRAFVEERRRIAAEEAKRIAQAEVIRLAGEQAVQRRADEEAKRIADEAARARAAEETARQQAAEKAALEREERIQREMEDATAAEQIRKAEEAARFQREEEARQRAAADDKAAEDARRTAEEEDRLRREADGASSAPMPGPGKSRRAVLIGAGALGALGLGWLATGGGATAPVTPTAAATQIPPASAPTPVSTRSAATSTPAAVPTLATGTVVRRIGADRAILTLVPGVEMEFVRVPAGEFPMGSDTASDNLAYDDEMPQHSLYLPEYWIGRTEVTVVQYSAYLKATGVTTRTRLDTVKRADHPVIALMWDDCYAFCRWAGTLGGGSLVLPSESEWEKAARGTDGRIYPWGNDAPDKMRCNFNINLGDTNPVGMYGAIFESPYGCADMAGNAWEWSRSHYKQYPYLQADGRESYASRDDFVLRGGSFSTDGRHVRCAYRYPYQRYDQRLGGGFGFRPVLYLTTV